MADATNKRTISERTARVMEIMENLNQGYEEFYKWMEEQYEGNNSIMEQCYDKWSDFVTMCLDYICMDIRSELCESCYKTL